MRKWAGLCWTTHQIRLPLLAAAGATAAGAGASVSRLSAEQQRRVGATTMSISIVCDQCGEVDLADYQRVLAVCNAPGCGVAFAQCRRCKADYEGCCSAACQTLALASNNTRNSGDSARGNGGPSGLHQQAAGSSSRRPSLLNLSDQPPTARYDSSARAEGVYESGLSVGGMERVSRGNRLEAAPVADTSSENRDVSAAARNHAGFVAGGGDDGDLSAVDSDSYASRHSLPESPCLARVREATNR